MILKKGNLYTDGNIARYDWIGFTANSVVKPNGALVMGAGSAKVVRDKWEGIDKVFGNLVTKRARQGIYLIVADNTSKVFAFQTKVHYRDTSPLQLVERSVKMLKASSCKYDNLIFALPFPGISNGGLNRDTVLDLIKELPDNVHVWELDTQ